MRAVMIGDARRGVDDATIDEDAACDGPCGREASVMMNLAVGRCRAESPERPSGYRLKGIDPSVATADKETLSLPKTPFASVMQDLRASLIRASAGTRRFIVRSNRTPAPPRSRGAGGGIRP